MSAPAQLRVASTAFDAWRDGVRRLISAPAILAWAWLATTLVGLPLTIVMGHHLADRLDHSLAADTAARGVDYEWMQSVASRGSGLETTFRPTIVGFAAVLDNLSALADASKRPLAIFAGAGAYAVVWMFLAGGIIRRYARDRPAGAGAFVSACAEYFFRFIRLGIVIVTVDAIVFALLHPWMFDVVYPRLVRDVHVERTAFAIRVALYAVLGLLLAALGILFDYTKIRLVAEDRRSVLAAIPAALRFLRRNAASAVAVYAMNVALLTALWAAYATAAPRAGGVGLMVWPAVIIGQAYIVGRLCIRLLFWASATSLMDGRLGVSRH